MEFTLPLWVYYVIGFPLLLGPLITVHELGHYLVGRWFGVGAEAFSIGFGKELVGWTDKRGTRWKLCALPLGGYVQFKGDMNPASIPDADLIENATPEQRNGSFHHAALWKRALIVFAGPATNILVTLAIFGVFFATYGKPVEPDPEAYMTIASFVEDSPAKEAGLHIGDRIVALDGARISEYSAIQDKVFMHPGRLFELTIVREDRELTFPVRARAEEVTDNFGNRSTIGVIGIMRGGGALEFAPTSIAESARLSVDHSIGIVDKMIIGIGQILSGQRSLRELGGPVKIAKWSGEQLSLGPLRFIEFAALISLNLAFINLLPIPALDGGYLAFYAAEAIRRKPVGARGQELAYRTGVAIVLALMLFVTVNDLISLPIFGS